MAIKIEKMNLNHLNELQEILISDCDNFMSKSERTFSESLSASFEARTVTNGAFLKYVLISFSVFSSSETLIVLSV